LCQRQPVAERWALSPSTNFHAPGQHAGWLWFGAGLPLHASSLAPNAARALADTSAYFGLILTVSIILFVVPIGLVAWRGAELPRWLAYLTFVFAAEQAVEAITFVGRRRFIAPGGAMNFDLGAALFLVWILGAGIAMSRASRPGVVAPLA
jgi:hypothetical protein